MPSKLNRAGVWAGVGRGWSCGIRAGVDSATCPFAVCSLAAPWPPEVGAMEPWRSVQAMRSHTVTEQNVSGPGSQRQTWRSRPTVSAFPVLVTSGSSCPARRGEARAPRGSRAVEQAACGGRRWQDRGHLHGRRELPRPRGEARPLPAPSPACTHLPKSASARGPRPSARPRPSLGAGGGAGISGPLPGRRSPRPARGCQDPPNPRLRLPPGPLRVGAGAWSPPCRGWGLGLARRGAHGGRPRCGARLSGLQPGSGAGGGLRARVARPQPSAEATAGRAVPGPVTRPGSPEPLTPHCRAGGGRGMGGGGRGRVVGEGLWGAQGRVLGPSARL